MFTSFTFAGYSATPVRTLPGGSYKIYGDSATIACDTLLAYGLHAFTASLPRLAVPPPGGRRDMLRLPNPDRSAAGHFFWVHDKTPYGVFLCTRQDSNPQPSDPKSDALSIELRMHSVQILHYGDIKVYQTLTLATKYYSLLLNSEYNSIIKNN